MKPVRYYLHNPYQIVVRIVEIAAKYLPDRLYIDIIFKGRVGYRPNLRNPSTFNEKLNWLKLYGRNKLYTVMADKYAVKKYVADIIGNEYVVENFLVADNWHNIDFDSLPDRFVIKCTHDSGGAFVCRDKSQFDFEKTRAKVEQNLLRNYFYPCREWPYKNIKPRILVDRYLDDHTGNELRDYKFWCFNGNPVYMYCTIKGDNIYENFYDMDFKPVYIDHGFPRHEPEFERPKNFELMKELAAKLSVGLPFIRVDFFDVDGHVYFGEFTFYDWAGLQTFGGKWDNILGNLIVLPSKN